MFLSMHSEVVFSPFDKLSIISTLKQQKKIPFDMYIVMTMDLKMIHLAADLSLTSLISSSIYLLHYTKVMGGL